MFEFGRGTYTSDGDLLNCSHDVKFRRSQAGKMDMLCERLE